LQIPRVSILDVRRHENKLKIGHLKSNRFIIKLRNVKEPLDQSAAQAETILSILARSGAPNYFGPQRFGNRQNTHLLGKAVIKGQPEEFMDLFLGRPQAWDIPAIVTACTFYEQGDYQKALESWPVDFREQRHTLKILMKYKANRKKTFKSLDNRLKGFFIAAFQSYLFNKVIAARMPAIDKLLVGDMAYKHDNGACFYVEDAQKEQPRCDNFEISPTGPLIGHRMAKLSGPAGDIENPVLDQAVLDEQDFTRMKRFGGRGGRRPIRFRPHNCQINTGQDDSGPFLELRFELDSGCYATSLLREITKSDFS
jgi:tRNA pseudouridine13 synthase